MIYYINRFDLIKSGDYHPYKGSDNCLIEVKL